MFLGRGPEGPHLNPPPLFNITRVILFRLFRLFLVLMVMLMKWLMLLLMMLSAMCSAGRNACVIFF